MWLSLRRRRLDDCILDYRYRRSSAAVRRTDFQGALQAAYPPHSHRPVGTANCLVDDIRF
jgi:hypothetical protein